MTPENKGSVIERPVSQQVDWQEHSSADDAAGGLSQNGAPHRSSKRNDSAVSNGNKDASRSSDEPAADGVDGVMGEAVPLQERLIVSPCPGRFHAGAKPDKAHGEYILKGQEIGRIISSDREVVAVKSAFSGWIMGYLVPEGSPVRVAEPVAWLRPH